MTSRNNEPDLFSVKNAFYIGNYQLCINEAQKLKGLNADLKIENDFFSYRALIAQKKYRIVIDEINNAAPIELQAVKLLAEYFLDPIKNGESTIASFEQHLSSYQGTNPSVAIIGATLYLNEECPEKALKASHAHNDVECFAINIQAYLGMHRVDVANKELKKMQELDEDATLTQLATAWIGIKSADEKSIQDAYYTVQEIIDQYGPTPILLNMQAVCYVIQGKYDEAEFSLQGAMDKDSDNADTLVNLIALTDTTTKSSEIEKRYLSQLKDSHSQVPYMKDWKKAQEDFERLCAEYRHTYG